MIWKDYQTAEKRLEGLVEEKSEDKKPEGVQNNVEQNKVLILV